MMVTRQAWKAALQGVKQHGAVLTRVRAEGEGGQTVPREALDNAYDRIADTVDLVPEYHEDGCYARAQLLCDGLDERGITSAKIFVTPLYKDLRTEEMPTSQGWRYHVATVALTSDSGAQVLDPLLSEDPLPVEEWFSSIWQGGVGVVSLHSPSKYLNGLTFSRDREKHHVQAELRLREIRKICSKRSS